MPATASGLPQTRVQPVSPEGVAQGWSWRERAAGEQGWARVHQRCISGAHAAAKRAPAVHARAACCPHRPEGKSGQERGQPAGSFVIAVSRVVGGRAVALLLQHTLRRL